jgi:hypothetical protein
MRQNAAPLKRRCSLDVPKFDNSDAQADRAGKAGPLAASICAAAKVPADAQDSPEGGFPEVHGPHGLGGPTDVPVYQGVAARLTPGDERLTGDEVHGPRRRYQNETSREAERTLQRRGVAKFTPLPCNE